MNFLLLPKDLSALVMTSKPFAMSNQTRKSWLATPQVRWPIFPSHLPHNKEAIQDTESLLNTPWWVVQSTELSRKSFLRTQEKCWKSRCNDLLKEFNSDQFQFWNSGHLYLWWITNCSHYMQGTVLSYLQARFKSFNSPMALVLLIFPHYRWGT